GGNPQGHESQEDRWNRRRELRPQLRFQWSKAAEIQMRGARKECPLRSSLSLDTIVPSGSHFSASSQTRRFTTLVECSQLHRVGSKILGMPGAGFGVVLRGRSKPSSSR